MGSVRQKSSVVMLLKEVLDGRSSEIIRVMDSHFSTRNFIWEFMNSYEEEYIDLLLEVLPPRKEDRKPRIIHELHKRIGQYLLHHANELGIEKDEGPQKEGSISPFGKQSFTQRWRKTL